MTILLRSARVKELTCDSLLVPARDQLDGAQWR